MWIDAYAQVQGDTPPPDPTMGMLITLLQFLPILVIVYFLIIRPQRQRQKQQEKMIKALKKGDRVLTSGGIFGTIMLVEDAKAVLKIAENTKVEVSKSSIVQVVAETK